MARAGRRPGQNETRERILAAARGLFAKQGFERTTVRAIAAEAGVNPAMLHHYFGSKQQVFVAAMNLPFNPSELIPRVVEGPRDTAGERLARTFLGFWKTAAGREPFLALLRSVATNEQAAAMMRDFMDTVVLTQVADALGVPKLRLSAAAAQLMGIALLRYIVAVPPLANAGDEELVAMLGPVLQRYLDSA